MAMAAGTKDCTSLSDTELVEMADLSAERAVFRLQDTALAALVVEGGG